MAAPALQSENNTAMTDTIDITPCLNLKLRQANRVLTSYYDSHLRDLGLTVEQFSVLRSLWYMKKTSQKSLQEVLIVQQTTLTRNLRPLIREGYVQTEPSPEDGRVTLVSLTADGKKVFQKARKKWEKAQQSVAANLGEQMTEQLLKVASAITDLR